MIWGRGEGCNGGGLGVARCGEHAVAGPCLDSCSAGFSAVVSGGAAAAAAADVTRVAAAVAVGGLRGAAVAAAVAAVIDNVAAAVAPVAVAVVAAVAALGSHPIAAHQMSHHSGNRQAARIHPGFLQSYSHR